MFIRYTPKVKHIKVIPIIPSEKEGDGYNFDNESLRSDPVQTKSQKRNGKRYNLTSKIKLA